VKPVLLNTYDFGGAGTATGRIHEGLRRIGVDSTMLVQIQRGNDPGVVGPEGTLRRVYSMARVISDALPLKLYGGAKDFSVNWMPDDIGRQLDGLDPDVVHLNWVGENFFSPSSLGDIDQPIVWRLPDMWAFTGGCHYADGCEGYKSSCGNCPQLDSARGWDLSRWTWRRKSKAWAEIDITVVGPSEWIAQRARESSLFGDRRIEVIPNGLDTAVYKPYEQTVGRDVFDLPTDARIVLFGAASPEDPRKGADLLDDALSQLEADGDYNDVVQVVFGTEQPEQAPDTNLETRYMGYLNDDESLALLYAAADVMVVPSRYEGFGQTASEALACGTPVVAFDATGPSDIVDHRENGYLATPYNAGDLATGIEWVLDDTDRRDRLGAAGREKALEQYDMETVAAQYRDLYAELI
jgi:glycosyltransferase involved in cell wall biosynthesis